MTSKLVVNTIEADTGISSVSFASSISLSSTSVFHLGDAGLNIGADTNISRLGNGILGFNINGTEKARIDSNGNFNLGLTASPVSSSSEQGVFLAGANSTQSAISSDVTPFVVNRVGTCGNDRNCIELRNNGTLRGTIGAIGAANGIFFQSGTTEVVRIGSSGQIGLSGANYGTAGQVLTSQGSGSAVQWATPTPAAGSVVQTLSFFGAEETVGAQITTNKINSTFTPLYTGSKFAVWLTVPNITGQAGAYNTFRVYLGTSSTPQNNTQVIKVGQRTFGTSGQDDLMCLSSADYGNFTNSGTGTHYASLRVTSGQYPVTIARHSDGSDSMKVKLILQEIKQ